MNNPFDPLSPMGIRILLCFVYIHFTDHYHIGLFMQAVKAAVEDNGFLLIQVMRPRQVFLQEKPF